VDGAISKFDSWLNDEGAVIRMLDRRRFPPPWTVDEQALCFVVRDQNAQAIARLYFEVEPASPSTVRLLPRSKARWIAAKMAKLPDQFRSS